MTRYEELCQIYAEHQNRIRSYHEDSVTFAEQFVQALSEDFSLTPDKISFRDEKDRRFNGHPRAYLRLYQDGYYHLRFGIKLEEGKRTFPKEDFVQEISFKKETPEATAWILNFPQGMTFSVPADQGTAGFKEVTDTLYQLIGGFYRNYLTQFLSPEPNVAPIGFKTESLGED